MFGHPSFPSAPRTDASRLANIDALRVVLILLGVVLHAADVYRPAGWLVADRDRSALFQVIADFIHIFRMPMLFFISGLLMRLSFRPDEFSVNVVKRSIRLVLPFVVIAFTLNAAIQGLQTVCALSSNCVSWNPHSGDQVQHLWFLSDLFLFTLLGLLGLRFRHRAPRSKMLSLALEKPLVLFSFLCGLTILLGGFMAITPYRYFSIGFGSGLLGFVYYGSFFFGGCLLGKRESIRLLDAIDWKIGQWFGLGLVLGICLYARGGQGSLRTVQTFLLEPIAAWAMVFAMWKLVTLVPRSLVTSVGALAPLCFTMYLVHTFFVVLLGWSLTSFNLPVVLKFVLLTVMSSSLSIYVALLVRRNAWLKLLLNGVVPSSPSVKRLDGRQKLS